MITSSSSRRRATVKVKGPKRKAPPTKEYDPSAKSESVFGSGSYTRPQEAQGWAQRHPMAVLLMAVTSAAAAVVGVIYLIPKSTPTHYYDGEKKTQPTLSALDTSLARSSSSRRTPTDDSFLDTHYRNSTNAGSGASGSGGSPGSASASKASSNTVASSYGDGTVTRKGNNCDVSATGSGNFASALADCVNAR